MESMIIPGTLVEGEVFFGEGDVDDAGRGERAVVEDEKGGTL